MLFALQDVIPTHERDESSPRKASHGPTKSWRWTFPHFYFLFSELFIFPFPILLWQRCHIISLFHISIKYVCLWAGRCSIWRFSRRIKHTREARTSSMLTLWQGHVPRSSLHTQSTAAGVDAWTFIKVKVEISRKIFAKLLLGNEIEAFYSHPHSTHNTVSEVSVTRLDYFIFWVFPSQMRQIQMAPHANLIHFSIFHIFSQFHCASHSQNSELKIIIRWLKGKKVSRGGNAK